MTGWRDTGYTEVLGGLQAGDRVVVGEVGMPNAATAPALPPGVK
jgi:hypothetical protein